MTFQVILCYETVRQVAGLESELKANGFDQAQVLPNGTVPNRGSIVDLTNAISKLGVLRATAAGLADTISRGGAVAIVPAHFGAGGKATEIMKKYNPIVDRPAAKPSAWDDAAPFSSLLRLPVITKSQPFKGHSGTPLIIEQDGAYRSNSGEPLVIKQTGGYRSMSGTPLLLDGGPYKSFSGTPLLIEQKDAYSSFSGTPLLVDSNTLFLTRA